MTEKILSGILLDEKIELSVHDLSQACSCSIEWVVALVDEGALEPTGDQPEQWRFSGNSLRRAHRAIRLQRDLDINISGVALALDLLDELEELESRLRKVGDNSI